MRINTGELEINLQRTGTGEPLVLIHGLGMSHRLWRDQVPEFARHFEVIAVDLRGFGASDKPERPGAYAIPALAQDIAAVIAELGHDGAHVLGTSMGGFVALQLGITHPEICRSLVLCHTGATMSIPPDILAARVELLSQAPLSEYAALVTEQALAPGAGPTLKDWVHKMIVNNDKRAYAQVLTEGLRDFDVRAEVTGITLPTQVIIGELDRVIPPQEGRALAQLIPGARLDEINGVGHLGYAEQPAQFNQRVLAFLSAQQAP